MPTGQFRRLPHSACRSSRSRIEPNLPKVSQLTASANPAADKLITEAIAAVNAQPAMVIEARQKLNDALALPLVPEQQKTVKEQLAALADKWLFSKTIFAEDKLCGSYKVKPGDRLTTIAQEYKVPYEILMQINGIPRARGTSGRGDDKGY